MNELTGYDAPNTEMTIGELAFEANEYERRSTKGIQWVIIYKINSGERLLTIQSRLGSRKFDPWLRVSGNFISGRTEAYKNMALAKAKDSIRSQVERIECVSDAFRLIGKYIQPPITAIQTETPESQADSMPVDDGASMPSLEPASLANGAGGSPAPTEAEQVLKDRRLKPEEMASFESGLGGEFQEQYLCFGDCGNFFYEEKLHTVDGNRYCYSCRQTIDEPDDGEETPESTPLYETNLFDEVPPEPHILPDANGTLPGSNGQAATGTVEPPAMTERDPYDEMLSLADEIFPLLSSMGDVRTYGIYGPLRRFIELFREIHQLTKQP